MKFTEIRNGIIKAAHEYLGVPVVLSNQVDPEVDYPFVLYSVVTPYTPDNSAGHYHYCMGDNAVSQVRREDPTAVLSFTVCSKNREHNGRIILGEDEALDLAERLQGWFLFVGIDTIRKFTTVVDDVTNVQSRSFLQVEEEARRWGFDVTIRYIRTDEKEVGTIEKVNIREEK